MKSVPTAYDLGLLLLENRPEDGTECITEDTGIIWKLERTTGWVPTIRAPKKKKDSPAPQTFSGYKDFNNHPNTRKRYVPNNYGDNPLVESEEQAIPSFDIKDFNNHPRTRMRYVPGKYADNPMTEEESTDTITLDRLQSLMNKGGVDDQMIKSGMEISRVGYQKLAREMKITAKEAKALHYALITKLRQDDKESDIQETYQEIFDENDNNRYSYERDYIGNMTIRDAETGNEVFLQGEESFDLQDQIEANPDKEQEILADYMDNSLTEDQEDNGDDSYDKEINSDVSSYNFPWKFNDVSGTGTVEYSGNAEHPKIKLVSIRNMDGDEIEVDADIEKSFNKQAIDFISNA